jgi:MYXO-CTERM domain-containing protein
VSYNDRVILLPESRVTAGLALAAALLVALHRRRRPRC